MRSRRTYSVIVVLMVFPFAVRPELPTLSLGGKPICEPSSAVITNCSKLTNDNVSGECILIADNEKKKNLYVFPTAGSLVQTGVDRMKKIKLNDEKVDDMEALVILPENRILVVGSHSRNSSCEIREERRRFALIERHDDDWDVKIERHGRDGILRCKDVLTWSTRISSFGRLVCASLEQAETHATSVERANLTDEEQAKDRCEENPSLNIEGAVRHEERVWIGLRSPLATYGPDNDQVAILLRLKKRLTSIKSSGIAFVDLDGWGIREIRAHAGSIWLIAGPTADSSDEFKLYRFPNDVLEKNALITPVFVRSLPTSSEGLAFGLSHAFVVIDGDENNCDAMPGSYISLELNGHGVSGPD